MSDCYRKNNLKSWILLSVFTFFCHSTVYGLYSPMPYIEMAVPLDISTSEPLVAARTLPAEERPVSYLLQTRSGEHWFNVHKSTGELTLQDKAQQRIAAHTGRKVSLYLTEQDNITGGVPLMNINVTFIEASECDKLSTQDLCFWRSVRYQVYENQAATVLGRLGPAFTSKICPNYTLSYRLINGTNYVSVASDGVSLQSRESLDRDTGPDDSGTLGPGPELRVHVNCTVDRGLSISEVATTVLVIVLDEDDNAPVAQIKEHFLNGSVLKKGIELDAQNLLFIDKDTDAVNNYNNTLLNDTEKLFNFKCDKWLHDRVNPHTVIHCKVRAKKTTPLPWSPYQMVLRINDTSLQPGYGPSYVDMHLKVTKDLSHMTSMSQKASWSREKAKQYPQHVSVFRGASLYARIAEPQALHDLVISSSAPSYGLETPTDAFKVTRRGGIIYVSKVTALHKMPDTFNLTIVVTFSENKSDKVEIRVDVTSDGAEGACNDTTWWQKRTEVDWALCSEKVKPESCEELCGVGTGRAIPVINGIKSETGSRGCVWRGSRTPSVLDTLTKDFATCTADIVTCPDFLCDPLEELHVHICPQDCTKMVTGAGYRNEGRNYNRGIASASSKAICTCDPHNKCACAAPIQKGEKKKGPYNNEMTTLPPYSNITTTQLNHIPRDPNVSAERATTDGPCGTECLAWLVAVGFIVVCSIIGLCLCWKYRMTGKGRGDRKYVGSVGSLPGVQSDYVERALQSGDGQFINYDPANPIASTDPRTVPDPKWEFPRSRLIIDQTLGEGEFGRVLRARALDIGGASGCTTVAVKTLKEDASAAELTDLLSEYQLLKEVNHPNVIRLLGACTTPGAPVYLIIEFAEYGSLRNYLRKSRHLESEVHIQRSFSSTPTAWSGTPVEMDRTNIPATPKDILSFAWQISKGMAYLSDIKLVHRDLAARNVLVAAGKMCKISDFGLTRDVYEDDAYLKRSKGRVPVKWMALESLADHVYTSKSDVWSFGVLLWELVTLGASPYPGVAVHNLFHLLTAGYRMEKPENCSIQLYRVMTSCWNEDASERPSFKELTVTFEQMLEDGVEYLDLNPRIVHNRTYFTCPRDILDNESEDVGYGNFSALQNGLIGCMTQPQHQLFHEDTHNDLHGSERFKQTESQLQRTTPEDEQHLLQNYGKENALLIAKTSKSLENQKHLYQNEMRKYNESPRPSNAYLTPIRQQNLSNEHTNGTRISPVVSSGRPQSYLNMDGNVSLKDSEQSDSQKQQDMLFFLADKTSHSSDNTSKVTYF